MATLNETAANLDQYQSWDLGALGLNGNYLTVGLIPLTSGWNDYQPVSNNGGNAAYLTVTYASNVATAVSEPSSLALLGLGLLGLGFLALRRRDEICIGVPFFSDKLS